MITTAVLAFSGFALAPQQADPLEVFLSDSAHTVTLAVACEPTHFAARNLAEDPLFLSFVCGNHGVQTAFWLPAGCRYDEEFPRGTLDGVTLEVFASGPNGWTASGALALEPCTPDRSGQFWVLSCGHAVILGGEGESLTALAPAGSLLPSRLDFIRESHEAHVHAAAAPFHVPVPRPVDKPVGDKPPKLEKKPLPAV